MKLIESKAEYIPQEPGLEGIYKMIEVAGRVAYHSEDKITPDSAKGFVDRMIKSNHGACLEHGTVYLAMPMETVIPIEANGWAKYAYNSHSKGGTVCEINGEKKVACTTNLRVLQENDWLEDLQYLYEPTEFHEKRYTMKFTCDRGVSHELVRHRAFSFLQESTRYCNYSKNKFGNELTFIIPSWVHSMCIDKENHFDGNTFYRLPQQPCIESAFFGSCLNAENHYKNLITEYGLTPQQARQILPNALKTEVIMTGFASDWKHFFGLRLFGKTGAPHPDMKLLAEKAQKAMQKAGIWDDIMSKPSKFE